MQRQSVSLWLGFKGLTVTVDQFGALKRKYTHIQENSFQLYAAHSNPTQTVKQQMDRRSPTVQRKALYGDLCRV